MKHSITVKDFYPDYIKDREDWPIALDEKTYKNLIIDFFQSLKDLLIKDVHEFKMPFRLGYLSVRKAEINHKRLKVDFKKTKELNKTVYHLNMHSDNFYFFMHWDKYNSYCKFTNASYYKFKLVRKAKREMAAYIKQCNSDPYTKNYEALRVR